MLAQTQLEEGKRSKLRQSPCQTLCQAAGLHGKAHRRSACSHVLREAVQMLTTAGVSAQVIAVMSKTLTSKNVQATAMKILVMPELLYLPACMRAHITETQPQIRTHDLDTTLLSLCFVCGTDIYLNYTEVNDIEGVEPRQVWKHTHLHH